MTGSATVPVLIFARMLSTQNGHPEAPVADDDDDDDGYDDENDDDDEADNGWIRRP